MATYTPPPYFPQSSLNPTDPHKYRKFKLIIAAIVLAVLLGLAGIVVGIIYLIKWLA
jgi:cell division septal protein FtsQ